MLVRRHAAALATSALAAAGVLLGPAPSSQAQTAHHPFVVHLDLAARQQPENLLLAPDGATLVTFALTGQVARVTRRGAVEVIAQLPAPADGDVPVLHAKTFATGLDRTPDGTLYVALSTGTASGTGVWRVHAGDLPVRMAALPATSLLNGLTVDPVRKVAYVADSVAGVIWRVPLGGGTAEPWLRHESLVPSGLIGVNGVRLHGGAVWATNLDAGALIRVPVTAHGAAGRPTAVVTGLGAPDDFAFIGNGDELLVTEVKAGKLRLVRPGRSEAVRVLLRADDGLSNPTAVGLRDGRVVVTSAAYFTAQDPNVLTIQLPR